MQKPLFFQQRDFPKLTPVAVTATNSNNNLPSTSSRLFITDSKTKLKFLIDSGSDISALPASHFKPYFKDPDHVVSAANGSTINIYGTKLLNVDLNLRRNFPHTFFIAQVSKPIIGADFLRKYGFLIDVKNQQLIDPTTGLTSKGSVTKCDTNTPKFFYIESEFSIILQQFPKLMEPPDFN